LYTFREAGDSNRRAGGRFHTWMVLRSLTESKSFTAADNINE
jgi:hypothetical protein